MIGEKLSIFALREGGYCLNLLRLAQRASTFAKASAFAKAMADKSVDKTADKLFDEGREADLGL